MFNKEVIVIVHAVFLSFASIFNFLTFRNKNKLKLNYSWTIFLSGHYYQISVDVLKNMAFVLRHYGNAKEKHIKVLILKIQRIYKVSHYLIIMPELIFKYLRGYRDLLIPFLSCTVWLFSPISICSEKTLRMPMVARRLRDPDVNPCLLVRWFAFNFYEC